MLIIHFPISTIHHYLSNWFHYSIIPMLIFWRFTSGVFFGLELSAKGGCSLRKIFMQMVGSTASGLQWKSKNNQVMHQRCSLKIDSTKDCQKWNQWFRDIVGIKVCLTACQIQAKKPKARSPVQVLAGSDALLHVNRDWSWHSVKFYPGILLQNLINVWTSFLCSQATFYCGAWDSCWASTESIAWR